MGVVSSIKSSDVANGSLLAKDFKPGQLAAGAQGPKGDTGAPGPQVPVGGSGLPPLWGPGAISSYYVSDMAPGESEGEQNPYLTGVSGSSIVV